MAVILEQPISQKVENDAAVTQIFNQTVHGDVTHVTATDHAKVTLSIEQRDINSMVSEGGIARRRRSTVFGDSRERKTRECGQASGCASSRMDGGRG
jgi:hypothetical protein